MCGDLCCALVILSAAPTSSTTGRAASTRMEGLRRLTSSRVAPSQRHGFGGVTWVAVAPIPGRREETHEYTNMTNKFEGWGCRVTEDFLREGLAIRAAGVGVMMDAEKRASIDFGECIDTESPPTRYEFCTDHPEPCRRHRTDDGLLADIKTTTKMRRIHSPGFQARQRRCHNAGSQVRHIQAHSSDIPTTTTPMIAPPTPAPTPAKAGPPTKCRLQRKRDHERHGSS